MLGLQADARFGDQDLGFLGGRADGGAFTSTADLAAHVAQALGRPALCIEGATGPIRRIAWCTGGAQGYFEAAIAAGLVAVVCIGETEAERDAGRTLDVVGTQLHGSVPAGATAAQLVIAYEPVWAIGTGRTPTIAEIAEVHAFIRARLTARIGAEAAGVRLLYGGSVKPSNAAEIFAVPHVDGALVGRASRKAADFGAIVAALSAA